MGRSPALFSTWGPCGWAQRGQPTHRAFQVERRAGGSGVAAQAATPQLGERPSIACPPKKGLGFHPTLPFQG
jgi:hypothetical protein